MIYKSTTDNVDSKDSKNQICLVGSKIKVKWSVEKIGDSGWKPGWYTAFVEGYDDEITVSYPSEPGCVYKLSVTPRVEADEIRLLFELTCLNQESIRKSYFLTHSRGKGLSVIWLWYGRL